MELFLGNHPREEAISHHVSEQEYHEEEHPGLRMPMLKRGQRRDRDPRHTLMGDVDRSPTRTTDEDLRHLLGSDRQFEGTLGASSALEAFADQGYITDLIAEVKSGKEASVYCCRAHPSTGRALLAAKVYSIRAAARYRTQRFYGQGRERIYKPDSRAARAMKAKSRHGRELIFADWVGQEFDNLSLLHQAGADVPKPFSCAGSGILMDYIGDETRPAPTLVGATLSEEEAQHLFDRTMRNIRLFLLHDRVHGDLSPYNMLLCKGRLTIIDLPQMVHARWNDAGLDALTRDIERVSAFFTKYGIQIPAADLAVQTWTAYRRQELEAE